jgi:hypothetical protein
MTSDRQCGNEGVHREHSYDLEGDRPWTIVEGTAYFCDGVLPATCPKLEVHDAHPWFIPYQGQRWCDGARILLKEVSPGVPKPWPTSTTRPSNPYIGQVISETDTGNTLVYQSATTGWTPTGCTCTADDCIDPHCPIHGSLRGEHTDGVGSRHQSPKMISPGLWPRPTGIIEVRTRVILSLLPLDHVDCDLFAITVEWRGPRPYMFEAGREDIGQWAICRMGRCLSRERDWHLEQNGGNADETEEQRKAWLRHHRFTYTDAMPIAKSMLPTIVVNRISVQTILDRDCPR